MKRYLALLIIFLVASTIGSNVFAAKKPTKTAGGVGIVTQKIKGDRGLNVTFSNLQNVRSVNYVLSYESSSQAQGAIGSIKPGKNKSIKRQLLYGTCSAGVCRYHKNVKKTVLEVTSTLKNGKQISRTYRIK